MKTPRRHHLFGCLAASALALGGCGDANAPDATESTAGSGATTSTAGTSSQGASSQGASGGSSSGASGNAGSGGSSESFDCTETAEASELVEIPAGEFVMGCNEAVDTACEDDEKPMHTVMVSAFQLERTEVTQGQYTACVLDGACTPPSCAWVCEEPNLPGGCLTWQQAQDYCAWAGRRLPSEAEWEKAARGTEGALFPWGDDAPECALANLADCSDGPAPAGSLDAGASPYGVLDMAGNMVEMVADWYDASYYESSPAADPPGPTSGSRYVGRGGGYKSEANWLRSSKRDWYDLTDQAASLGFRCAL
jgi:formylglycine-generating enzyme required for sulfatase activity